MTASEARKGPQGPHLWEIRAVRDLLWLVAILAVLRFVAWQAAVFAPLLLALFFAFLFDPLVSRLARRPGVPRVATVAGIVLVAAAVVWQVTFWLGPLLVEQVGQFISALPGYVEQLGQQLHYEPTALLDALAKKVEELRADPGRVIDMAWTGTGTAVQVVSQVVSTTTSIAMFAFLVPFYFFFLAWHYPVIVQWLGRFVPESRREGAGRVGTRMAHAVRVFFRGRVVIAGIVAALFAIGFRITGVPYWLLVGIVTGLLTIVPYASIIGWPLAILIKYLDAIGPAGAGFGFVDVIVWPSVAFGAVQFIEGWILTPWLQGRDLEIDTVTILVVVFLGGAVFGVAGMLVSVPLAACVKIWFEDVLGPRLEAWARTH